VFVGGYLLTRRRTALRLPMVAGFGTVAIAFALLVALPSIRDKEVNEQVVTGAPVTAAGGAGEQARGSAEPGGSRPNGNLQLASGSFRAIAHAGQGTAAVVELPSGERELTLTGFETDPGPDLRVYLATDRGADDNVDLDGLKGNVGNQQYEIPGDVDLAKYSTVVIWCRAFSVEFGSAELRGS
jgi:hypothetical protein